MPLIIPSNSISDGGYVVDNSLRFNDGSSDYLNRTPASAGTQTKATISVWLKRSNLTSNQCFFSTGNNNVVFKFVSNDKLTIYDYNGSSMDLEFTTTQVFRDVSAWYHIVVALDSTQATASDRAKIYVNGSLISNFDSTTYPSLNYNFKVNGTLEHFIGRLSGLSQYFNGYIAEFVNIDGQQLDPTSFGEFDEDSGIWKPIDVSGLTFGNNGFYLDFENSGSLGADVSGNGNNFTVNNLTAIDQSTDTCTNNFATWNPLRYTGNLVSFAEGNLKATALTDGSAFFHSAYSSIGVTQGKWYAEFKCAVGGNPTNNIMIAGGSYEYDQNGNNQNGIVSGITHYNGLGEFYVDTVSSTGLTTYTSGDIIGVALNVDDGQITFYKNGSQISTTRTLTTTASNGITYFIGIVRDLTVKSSWEANFGSPPFSISSGNTDGNGYGNFEYAPPSGYLSLCTKNLSKVLG